MEIGIDTFVVCGASGHLEKDEYAIENLLERIASADEFGLDVYGIGEHHQADMLDSAPAVLLAAAAARTKQIRLTSAVTGIGTSDPVRVFQQFATLDLISKGRAEIVAGRGASLDAFSLFGVNKQDSAEIFAENLELLLKIRENKPLTWSGKFRSSLDNLTVYPRPVQQKLPIWHAALRTPASFIRAGELGLPLMIAVIDGEIQQLVPLVDLYREAGLDAGFSMDELKVGFHSMGYIADTTEQATDEFYPGWAQAMTKFHGAAKSKSRFEIDLKSNGSTLLVGNPEEVAEKIIRLSDQLGGISRFCFQMDYSGLPHEKLMNSIKLIGTELMPRIKQSLS